MVKMQRILESEALKLLFVRQPLAFQVLAGYFCLDAFCFCEVENNFLADESPVSFEEISYDFPEPVDEFQAGYACFLPCLAERRLHLVFPFLRSAFRKIPERVPAELLVHSFRFEK